MGLVENLILLYAGILMINLIIAGILWLHDKEPLYRSVFFLWLTCIFALLTQGLFDQNSLFIVLGFSATFFINISLSHLLSQIAGIKVPYILFFSLFILSYPLAIAIHLKGFAFAWVALPVVSAVGFPALFSGIKALVQKWNNITISVKALSITTCILGIHNIDFAFLRLSEGFALLGFSIVIIIIFCLSIFVPAVVMEVLKEEETLLKETNKLKSAFFANISHEIRTPLTLILGPVNYLLSAEKDETKKRDLLIIQRNATRLLKLINQLLDFSKIESGNISLKAERGNMVSFIKGLLRSFDYLADKKGIVLDFKTNQEKLYLWFDHEKIEKAILNILSNAFKFTPNGGRVSVTINRIGKTVKISIADTGPGIPGNRLPFIFDRFYMADESDMHNPHGTGIGLALAKELVELHRGSIKVESFQGRGSTFSVILLKGKDHFSKDEIHIKKREKGLHGGPVEEIRRYGERQIESLKTATRPKSTAISKHEFSVLIVDDSLDMRTYVRGILTPTYKLFEAGDGKSAFKIAKKEMPDLVVSDIMMPLKDGYEFCAELKKNTITCHIPVILLTAKAEKSDKIKGLHKGADAYLIKPFDSEELLALVCNLLEQRQRLREKYRNSISLEPSEIDSVSVDDAFIAGALKVVEKNIAISTFDTTAFASEMALSRGHLNAKLKALTGLASHEFIRQIRLKRAAQLLKKKTGNISEIAYRVGFNSPSHFSKAFKDTFGILPSEYEGEA